MKKTEIKYETTEELMNKSIEDFLNEKIEEYNIVENVKRPMQVAKKMQTSMMLARPKINHHNLDLSKISNNYAVNGNEYGYAEIKPKEIKQTTLPAEIRTEVRAAGLNKVEWTDVKDLPMGMNTAISEIKQTTLPAEIRTEVRAAGLNKVEWTDVKDLPMGMNTAISEMGKKVFQAFGLKEGAAIHTISSFKNNDLLNSNLELNSVLGFLEKHTEKVFKEPATQIFDTKGKPYEPKIQLYYTQEKAYLAVFEGEGQGMEGNYIYAFKRDPKLSLKK